MPPHGHRKVTLRCGPAVTALRFLKKYNVKSKKTQGLRWLCGVLKTARSPCSLHKNRKAAVRFVGLRSPYCRRKHAASYMWPWHNAEYVSIWWRHHVYFAVSHSPVIPRKRFSKIVYSKTGKWYVSNNFIKEICHSQNSLAKLPIQLHGMS